MKSLIKTLGVALMCNLLLCSCQSTTDEKIKNNSTKSNKVLLVGIEPKKLDFSKIKNLTEQELTIALENQKQKLILEGYDAKWCLVDLGKTAEKTLSNELIAHKYDLVLVGAGIRTLPENFQLFENLINVIHSNAPTSKICFNTNPYDSELAVKRWLKL